MSEKIASLAKILANQVQEFIEYENLCLKGDQILVALSAGPDSIALLYLLKELGYDVSCAHMNFQLRAESSAEQVLAEEICEKLGVSIHVKQTNTNELASQQKKSIQEAARDARYSWFKLLCKKHNYSFIATAHHLDDNIETLHMNLISQCGIDGIKGIPPKNEFVIRPLLAVTKTQLIDYLNKEGIAFATDESNFEDKYFRNSIRLNLIPQLESLNSAYQNAYRRNFQNFREQANIVRGALSREIRKLLKHENNISYVAKARLKNIVHLRSLLHFWLSSFSFSNDQIESVVECVLNNKHGQLFNANNKQLLVDRKWLVLSEPHELPGLIQLEKIPSKLYLTEDQVYTFKVIPSNKLNKLRKRALYLDYDKLQFPLIIKPRAAGDYFYPYGLNKKKKLKKYLTDIKVSAITKQKLGVLWSGNQLCALIGLEIDHRIRVTDSTQQILKIEKIS